MGVRLHFFGAAGCVTGSCMLLEAGPQRILIDCGLFQGSKTLKELNYGPFPFDAKAVDAVLLTHAHIDHSGQLPKLMLAGFSGKIFATRGTRDLCSVMLPDAGAIQEMEVENLNMRNLRHGKPPVAPIYTRRDAHEAMRLFEPVVLDEWVDIASGVRARWWNAGHILGSASIEVEVSENGGTQTLLFSGDLGPGGRRFAEDPQGPSGVDHVVIESTYGDTVRAPISEADRKAKLAAEVMAAHVAGGPLLIPAFAVERTQELIIDLIDLMETNQAPPAPIFLDSPLAVQASEIFLRHDGEDGGNGAFARLRESRWLRFTEQPDESRAIERVHGWHVIIAASGMCDAGRVRHHLKRLLWQPEATVMLTGFQAVGTLGRLLQDGKRAVRIQGDDIKVAARIRSIDVYSGHADANALLRWAEARGPVRGGVFITHGEPESSEGLERRLRGARIAEGRIVRAQLDQSYDLNPGGVAAASAKPARLPQDVPGKLDWHNARSEFLARLHAKLDAAPDNAAREALLEALTKELG